MNFLNCEMYRTMLISGANNLENKHEEINQLNVFPVPDGDTGTNMSMTFGSGVREVEKLMNDHIGETSKVLSKNMLMGARGNSGVILSQIFKGIQRAVDGKQSVTVREMADAYENGVKVAYKAVMRPVEGTILTVVRESSEAGLKLLESKPEATILEYFETVYHAARVSLANTPELLAVLKEVGVVDSGGAGLTAILEGFVAALKGEAVKLKEAGEEKVTSEGYCVEIIVRFNNEFKEKFDSDKLRKSLSRTCNDTKCARNDIEAKIHVHTKTPGEVITIAQKFGDLIMVKVENIAISHEHVLDFTAEPKEKYAIIAVCNGKGIEELFANVGVKYFVSGGQTMNPPTESFVELINKINASNIIILPNNSNIIMAAQQVSEVITDKKIAVVGTTSIPEGISACIAFDEEAELEENAEAMNEARKQVVTGSVTHAIKDTSYNSIAINEGDYIGICGKEIVASTTDLVETSKALLDALISEESGFVTIIYGSETDQATGEILAEYVRDKYGIDCEVDSGQQDLYPFIIGVE